MLTEVLRRVAEIRRNYNVPQEMCQTSIAEICGDDKSTHTQIAKTNINILAPEIS